MYQGRGRGAAVPRRGVLRALALAPAALAGCAAGAAERPAPGAAPPAGGPGPAAGGPAGAPSAALAAIRAHAVPPDSDPAFVFRAAAARPGDLR